MITYGADPELAYVSNDGSIIPFGTIVNEIRSSFDENNIIPGHDTKGDRILVDKKNSLYVDGASLELNVAPSSSVEVVIKNIRKTLKLSNQIAKITDYKLLVNPSIPITAKQIEDGGVALTVFGCDPDTSIYHDNIDPSKIDAKLSFYRYFGGHLHSSRRDVARGDYKKILWYAKNIYNIILAHDFLVGTADVILTQKFNEECKIRRNVYGRAGRYRIQPYGGVEYRTPSNLWLSSPQTTRFMFKMMELSNSLIKLPHLMDDLSSSINILELFEIINNCDSKVAFNILTHVLNQMSNFMKIDAFDIPILSRENNLIKSWRI